MTSRSKKIIAAIGLLLLILVATISLISKKQVPSAHSIDAQVKSQPKVSAPAVSSVPKNDKRDQKSQQSPTKVRQVASVDPSRPVILANETDLKRWETFDLAKQIPFEQANPARDHQNRKTIEFTLFGERLVVDREKEEISKSGSLIWVGRPRNNPDALVTFATKDGVIIGSFSLIDRVMGIRHDEKFGNLLIEVVPRPIAIEGDSLSFDLNSALKQPAPAKPRDNWLRRFMRLFSLDKSSALLGRANAAEISTVDIMVLGRVGVANVELTAQNFVAYTNAAYVASGINVQLNLVYVSTSDQTHDQSPAPMRTESLLALINQYKPDVIGFLGPSCFPLGNGSSKCGVAYEFVPNNSEPAIGVFWSSVITKGDVFFAHEVSHTLGADHDDAQSHTPGVPAYARGWVSGISGTIMAYVPNYLPKFSSPSTYGDANHDNARIINETAPVVARRQPLAYATPLADQTVSAGSAVRFYTLPPPLALPFRDGSQITSYDSPQITWFKDGVPIPGQTIWNLDMYNVQPSDSGVYRIEVTLAIGGKISSQARLTVNGAPVQLPVLGIINPNLNFNVGKSTNISMTIGGGFPQTYQWYKDSVAIAGATSSTLNLTNLQVSDSGKYTLAASNSAGQVTSGPITVVVNPTTTQPLALPIFVQINPPVTLLVGSSTTLSVGTGGGFPQSYQWYRNGTAIPGATATVLNLSNIQLSDAGNYTVTATNTTGRVTSDPMVLTVTQSGGDSNPLAPTITVQPQSVTTLVNTNVTFSVEASGSQPFTYRWFVNDVEQIGIAGKYFGLFGVPVEWNGRTIKVIVSNAYGQVTSANAILTVTNSVVAPTITVQPRSISAPINTDATFTVEVSGTPPFTYTWFDNGIAIPGTFGNSMTYHGVTSFWNGKQIAVKVSNAAGEVMSATAILTVTGGDTNQVAPVITSQPQSVSVPAGSTAAFTVIATGTPPLTYTWFDNGTQINGNFGNSINYYGVIPSFDGRKVSVKVSNAAGEVMSAVAILSVTGTMSVGAPPVITQHPIPTTKLAGESFQLSVVANLATSYQWMKDGLAVPGATGSAINFTNVQESQSGSYSVVVSNSFGQVVSNSAQVTIGSAPVITTPPQSQSKTVGSSATLTVVATGGGLSYQWKKNGNDIGGATGPSFTISSVQIGDAGSYSVTVKNQFASVDSAGATLTVMAGPVISAQPRPLQLPVGASGSISVTASGTGALTYQWFKDGVPVNGAVSSTLNFANAQTPQAGNYFVQVTDSNGLKAMSDTAAVVIGSRPVITSQPQNLTIEANQTGTLTVVASGAGTLQYAWYQAGQRISGASSTLAITGAAGASGLYKVEVINSFGTTVSQEVTVSLRDFQVPLSGVTALLPASKADMTSSGGFNVNP